MRSRIHSVVAVIVVIALALGPGATAARSDLTQPQPFQNPALISRIARGNAAAIAPVVGGTESLRIAGSVVPVSMNTLFRWYDVLGAIATLIAFKPTIPQMWTNWKRQSADIISMDAFPFRIWSDVNGLLGCVLSMDPFTLISVFSAYLLMSLVFTAQTVFYKVRGQPNRSAAKISSKAMLIASSIGLVAPIFLIGVLVGILKPERLRIVRSIAFWAWCVLSAGSRIPQIRLIQQQRSSRGLSYLMYFYSICSNLFNLIVLLTFTISTKMGLVATLSTGYAGLILGSCVNIGLDALLNHMCFKFMNSNPFPEDGYHPIPTD